MADGVGGEVGEWEYAAGGVGAACSGKDADAERFETVANGTGGTTVSEQQRPLVPRGQEGPQGREEACRIGVRPFPTAFHAAQHVHRADGCCRIAQPTEVGEEDNFVRDGHIYAGDLGMRSIPCGEIFGALEFKNLVG